MSSDLMLMLWDSFVETVIMVGLSGFIGSVFGIPLGILLHVTDNGGVHPMPIFNKVLGWIINAVRSTPFIILLVAIIPLTRVIAGTSIGTAAAVVPLTIAVAPFIARLVETSLRASPSRPVRSPPPPTAAPFTMPTAMCWPSAARCRT